MKKDSSSKRIEPPHDNLDEYFGLSQSQNSQKTADVTPMDTPKKSEEAKSKNDPDGSSHRRVDKSPQGSACEGPPKSSSKLKQPVQDSADSSCVKVHKSPQGSAGEGLSGPSFKPKQSAQQTMKPESEDSSSSLSSSSSDSESLDEKKIPSKGKMKELPPPPPSRRETDLNLHPIPGVNIQSLNLDPILRSERMIDKVDLNLQEEMIDADIDHDQGAVCTPGPRDPHHI